MTRMVKKVVKLGMKLVYLFYNINVKKKIMVVNDHLHTAWVANYFEKIGKNCVIGCDFRVRGGGHLFLGDNVRFNRHCHLVAIENYIPSKQTFSPKINIGNNCYFNEYTHIASINSIKIGNGVQVGRFVLITDHSHGRTDCMSSVRPAVRDLISKGPVVIGDNVWIGDKVTICANVHIGQNAIVGANTVVTKNIPPNAVVAGNPARIIRLIG